MKKLAILTQPLKANYGGLIQNFALQSVLKGFGYNVETLSREYHRDAGAFRTLLAKGKNEVLSLLTGKKKKLFSKKEAAYVFSETYRFIREHLAVSQNLYSTSDLKQYFKNQHFSGIVVGSDQTWRPKYSPNIYNYFLDFIEDDSAKGKLAYATSFGSEQWEYTDEETLRCIELSKKFDAISVREESGVTLCKEHLKVESTWVLDPTLLLKASSYIELFKDLNFADRGLFSYVLDRNDEKNRFIEDICRRIKKDQFRKQPIRSIESGPIYDYSKLEDFKYPSLEEWLASFYYADFVITDSFHGTVFSIIFNKPFLSIVNFERGGSRFYSLLKLFQLEHRLVFDINNFNDSLLGEKIDYQRVNEILEIERQKSLLFLKENLK